jgi:hypothetical protein
METSFQASHDALQHATGIVIPVYLPDGIPAQRSLALLRDTIAAYCAQVADPAHVCLSVDGEACGGDAARELARAFGTQVRVAPHNRGKLQAAAQGAHALLDTPELTYIAVVDQDGDHFANELLNTVRAARHVAAQTGEAEVMVLGRRISPHRSMGWLRGELEDLADRVLLDALQYHAAATGRPLRLEYGTLLDRYPDFHSGYKLFDRATAEQVFTAPPRPAGVSDDGYYRHACEAVMSVEALVHGARLVVVNRSTFNAQPISTFGRFDHVQFTADMIIWPCKRLDVPPAFVRQWLANHIPPLQLNTLAPEGPAELRRVQNRVLDAFSEPQVPEAEDFLHPLFV